MEKVQREKKNCGKMFSVLVAGVFLICGIALIFFCKDAFRREFSAADAKTWNADNKTAEQAFSCRRDKQ